MSNIDCPSADARAFSAPLFSGESEISQLALFGVRPTGSMQKAGVSDEPDSSAWTEEDVVQLHWRLLLELRRLADAETPLEEKIDALNWVFTERAKESAPFSFVRCIAAVTQSPFSPTPFFGVVDVHEIKDWIRDNAGRWIRETLERYPAWVQQEVYADPDRAMLELDRNPQWINEEIRTRSQVGDFFG